MVDWRIRTSTPLPIEPSSANVVALAPDGSLIAVGHAGSVQVLDEAGQPLPRQPDANPVDELRPLAFSPDGAMLATYEQDSTVRVWDTTSGKLRWELPVPAGCGSGLLSFGPPGPRGGSGTIALGCFSWQQPGEGPAMTWRLTSSDPVPQLVPYSGLAGDPMAFSPNGRHLVLNGMDGSLVLIDIDSGNTVRSLTNSYESDVVLDAAFDASGQTLAISYVSGALELVDLQSGERRIRRGAHDPHQVPGGVQLALDPSGDTLYSLSDDGTARMWDVATFEPIGSALTAPTPLSSFSPLDTARRPLDIALTPDAKTLVAAGSELVRWNIGGSLSSRHARSPTATSRKLSGSCSSQKQSRTERPAQACPESSGCK